MLKNLTVVFGNGGNGATTFAAALAAHLVRSGKQTLLVSPDTRVPAFGLWVPDMTPKTKQKANSLGEIIARRASLKSMAEEVFTAPHSGGNLGLIGYMVGEASDKYVPVDRDTAEVFLAILTKLSEHVIVDASSHGDTISTAALRRAACRIRLIDPDPRGVLHHRSIPPEKADGKTVFFACPRTQEEPVDEVAGRLGIEFAGTVPFLEEAHVKLTEYRLFEQYDSRAYRAALEAASTAIFGEESK